MHQVPGWYPRNILYGMPSGRLCLTVRSGRLRPKLRCDRTSADMRNPKKTAFVREDAPFVAPTQKGFHVNLANENAEAWDTTGLVQCSKFQTVTRVEQGNLPNNWNMFASRLCKTSFLFMFAPASPATALSTKRKLYSKWQPTNGCVFFGIFLLWEHRHFGSPT